MKSRYYGELRVPQSGHFVQQTKQGGVESEALVQDDIAAHLVENMDENTLYIVGAGTTLQLFMDQLGLDNTLLGIDVVFQSELLSQDVSAEKLASLVAKHEGPVVAMLSVTGNQGSLIGRGNQQLTPSILRRVGRDNVWPVATKSKIKALSGRPLLLDSNDPQLDRQWQGYITVLTGYNDSILYLLGTSDSLPH